MKKSIQPLPNPSPKERGLTAYKKLLPFLISLILTMSASAQGEQASSGLMRSHLKIYVVVAVLVIIFLGIILFLFSLERRLKKLEDNNK